MRNRKMETDEYFVEGIDIDCKSAFGSYEERKRLREEYIKKEGEDEE